ncbi:MAG: PAS domain S-box protein [Phycisphaerae bacterium]|jgi:PAS domain S-box-containing protein
MSFVVVVGISTLCQLVAVVLAMRLTRTTGWRVAWWPIAGAVALSAGRRCVVLSTALAGGAVRPFDAPAEMMALTHSVLMLTGITALGPLLAAARRNKAALLERERHYHQLFDLNPDALFILDRGGHLLDVNRAAETRYGYTREELLGMTAHDLAAPNLREETPARVRHAIETGARFDWRQRCKNGEELEVEIAAQPIVVSGEPAILSSAHDNTERLRDARLHHERERLLREMSHIAKIGAWEFHPATGAGTWTEETARIHELDPDAETSVSLGLSHYRGESRRLIEAAIKRATEEGEPYDLELELTTAKGNRKWVRAIAHPIMEGGRVVRIRGTFQDITRRRAADETLRRKNRALKAISECDEALIHAADEAVLLQSICRIAVQHCGYRLAWVGFAEHDDGRHVRPVAQAGFEDGYLDHADITWADTERGRGPTGTAIRTGRPVVVRDIPGDPAFAPWRAAAVERGYASSAALPLKIDDAVIGALNLYASEPDAFDAEEQALLIELTNDLSYGLGVVRTREARTRAESALLQERQFLAAVLDNIDEAVVACNPEGVLTRFNQAARRVHGLGEGPTTPDHWAEQYNLYHANGEPLLKNEVPLYRALQGEHVRGFEMMIAPPAGPAHVLVVNGQPMFDADGELLGAVAAMHDITDRKRAEDELRHSERVLRLFVEHSPAAIAMFNNDMKYIVTSRRFLSDYHLGEQDLTGRSHYDVFPEMPQRWVDIHQRCLAGAVERCEEDPFPRVDGSFDWVRWEIHPWRESTGEIGGIILFSEVVTDRKQAREALAQQARIARIFLAGSDEEVFRELLSLVLDVTRSPHGMVGYTDETGTLVVPNTTEPWWNERRAVGGTIRFPRETWDDCVWLSALCRATTQCSNEATPTTSSVQGTPARFASVPIQFKGEVIGLLHVAGRDTDYTEADTQALEAVAEHVAPLLSAQLVRAAAQQTLHTLNTELEQRVRERTAQLEAANQELEAFSYSVSHDLRAPLRAMDGYARILVEEYAPRLEPDATRYLERVRVNARQMGQLIDDLLAFSRLTRHSVQTRQVALAPLVQEVLEDLREWQRDRPVEVTLGDLPDCEADRGLLKQLLTNLLANALKFTRGRNPARVEVGARQDGDETVYFVRDNGVGFDMRYADKLFGVFQRLHRTEDYEGTGVGLAIVQRIARRHGGRVWTEAEPEKGATFYFTVKGGTRDAPGTG